MRSQPRDSLIAREIAARGGRRHLPWRSALESQDWLCDALLDEARRQIGRIARRRRNRCSMSTSTPVGSSWGKRGCTQFVTPSRASLREVPLGDDVIEDLQIPRYSGREWRGPPGSHAGAVGSARWEEDRWEEDLVEEDHDASRARACGGARCRLLRLPSAWSAPPRGKSGWLPRARAHRRVSR